MFLKHKDGKQNKFSKYMNMVYNLLDRVSASHFPTKRYTSEASSFDS